MRYFNDAQKLLSDQQNFVTVTLLKRKGSVPQDVGAKMIVTARGLYSGTVGGGKVELKAIQHAQEILKRRKKSIEVVSWNLQRELGMSCGGEADFLFELHFGAAIQINIFGAGHIAQALTRMLTLFEWKVQVFDPRSDWVEKLPESQNLRKICSLDSIQEISKLSSDSYFLVMTQGHATDFPIIKKIFELHPAAFFVGVIGSQLKGKKIKKELIESGISPALVEQLHCPLGENFGTNHPSEIAVSILAQILKLQDQQKLAIAGRAAAPVGFLGLETRE